MANYQAIHSVGSSLVSYLTNTFPSALRKLVHSCVFKLYSSAEMNQDTGENTLSLFLYRITMNEHLRNARQQSSAAEQVPLSLNLHYLMTVWAADALTEQLVLGWAMRQLYTHETFTAIDLSPSAAWADGDVVQIVPAELSPDDMSRIWTTLGTKYRLSVSYIARVVRIDGASVSQGRPVVARGLNAGDGGGAEEETR